MRLFFLTIPKPLKQYTLFKKDDPFRSHTRICIYNKNIPTLHLGSVHPQMRIFVQDQGMFKK